MENEEAKHSRTLNTVSKCAGTGIGTVVKVGSIVKNSLTRPVDDLIDVVDEDGQAEVIPPPEKIKNSATGKDELVNQINALESELAEVRNRLVLCRI